MPISRFRWLWSAWGSRFDLLPVVSRADVHKLEGVVLLRDVLDSYGIGAENEG